MMNVLGIDYGRKRIGLSFADGDVGVAVPVAPLVNLQGAALFEALGKILQERKVDEIVIGYPLHMDGTPGRRVQEVEEFVNALNNRFGLSVHKVDERLSTARVEADFHTFGKKVSKKSGEIDSSAAALILQDFLEQRNFSTEVPEFLEFEDD